MNKEQSNRYTVHNCMERRRIQKGRIFGLHLAGRTDLEIAERLQIPLETVKKSIRQMEVEAENAEGTV